MIRRILLARFRRQAKPSKHWQATSLAHSTPAAAQPSVTQHGYKDFSDFFLSYWLQYVWLRVLVYGAAAAGSGYVLYHESELGVVNRMSEKFNGSTVDGWKDRDAKATIVRAELQKELKRRLQPVELTMFDAVVGASGTGKSTSMREAIRKLDKKGAIYFVVPPVVTDFSSELSAVLGYSHPQSIWNRFRAWLFGFQIKEQASAQDAVEPVATWRLISPLLRKAAEKYLANNEKKPPVLVLDAMDRVAKKNPELFVLIQEFAKECADAGCLLVVMVFSDGTALPLLKAHSSKSRALDPLEVGDIPDADAVDFVTNQHGLPLASAEALVDKVTGGRMVLLNKHGQSKKTFEQIQKELDIETDADLKRLSIPPTHSLFMRLMPTEGQAPLGVNEALLLLPDEAKLKELLGRNIIKQHPDSTLTFHSRHVETFFRAQNSSGSRWWQWW